MLARALKIVAAIAAAAAVGGLIYHFRLWERDWSTIDDGWANLIGSAIGAFLAVVGALYVSKAEERRKKKAFEDFVRVAVQNLVVQASYLEAMAREPHKIAPSPDVQHSIISIQQQDLLDALAVFDREISHSKDGEYHFRRDIIALDTSFAQARPYLTSQAESVQILKNWHIGAYQIRYRSGAFLEANGWVAPIPSATLIGKTIQDIVRAWRSWNIPAEDPTLRKPLQDTPHPPLHHAHA